MVATPRGLRHHALARLRLEPSGGWGGPTWSTNDSLIRLLWQVRTAGLRVDDPEPRRVRQVLMRGILIQPNWGLGT
jgi:hypothetical protein